MWQWDDSGRGSVAVGAWQRGGWQCGSRGVAAWQSGRGSVWQRGSQGVAVAVGAWQCGSRGVAAWGVAVWQLGRGSVAVRPWQRGSQGVAAWQSGRGSRAWHYSTPTPPLPHDCHTATPHTVTPQLPRCHAPTATLPRPDCHAAMPQLPRGRSTATPHCHAEGPSVPHRRTKTRRLALTCMYLCFSFTIALPFLAKKCKQEGLVNRSVITQIIGNGFGLISRDCFFSLFVFVFAFVLF